MLNSYGELVTGYVDEQVQRLQSTDMRRIANEALGKLDCRLIKSKEAVRSFGKPRNKRSRQAKQYRESGGGHLRGLKKDRINISISIIIEHMSKIIQDCYPQQSPHLNRGLRIAIDDKAHLKCGTSEGFSRPLHKPVQLSDNDMKLQLPASDYPQSCGYVSPGLTLMVNQMNEVYRT